MEALAISAANLDTIEKNLGAVANELSGVISNVNNVNSEISKVEEKVNNLNDEIKDLVKEIRETTIVNNARQNIMFNNSQIEKKYGYFDIVRRRVESIIDALENSDINKATLVKLREDLLLNNPNYWLSNALSSLISWILDDKINTEKELNNALKKNKQKTSLFFCLINLKFSRITTSLNWLKSYLNNEDPTNLSSDFVTILDLVSSNAFGIKGKNIIINKMSVWFKRLINDNYIETEEVNKWIRYINNCENRNIRLPYLEILSKVEPILKNNLVITSSYSNVFSKLSDLVEKNRDEKNVDEIINNLIYEYEEEEKIFKKDNLKNSLIIECNGNREKALEIFERQESIYSDRINLISLLNNIVIFSERYKVSNETQKFALSLIKNNILKAYEMINKNIKEDNIRLEIDGFNVNIYDELDKQARLEKIDLYLNNNMKFQEKNIYVYLFIINLISIIGLSITFSNKILSLLILIISLIIDIFIIKKIVFENANFKKAKKMKKDTLEMSLEKGYAEFIDYKNALKGNKKNYEKLKMFLERIDVSNYIKTGNERNLNIGE